MRRYLVTGIAGLVVALSLAAAVQDGNKPDAKVKPASIAHPTGKLIVHEWGTFTGFAGSDSIHLPFNTTVGSDLPAFVSNREKFAVRLNPKLGEMLLFTKGGGAPALQRMETPVIYFYADTARDVNVRVDFAKGLLTEFYPPVKDLGPAYGGRAGEYAAIASPQTQPAAQDKLSFLDWGQIKLIPHPTAEDEKQVPAVTTTSHYALARNTDASLVQFTDADGTRHEEKFLFYRGLGNFTLPVTLAAYGNDQFALRNVGDAPVTAAFLIQIDGRDAQSARFAEFQNINGRQDLTLPTTKSTQANLADAIQKTLVASGLYEKEARAMVETWKDNWLTEPGTRVLYILPCSVTDELLPLHITPVPDQMVRVLVGRIEILTPEKEADLRRMMLAAREGDVLSQQDAQTLKGLGRFYYPTLERTSKLLADGQTNLLHAAYQRADATRK